jgi:hypothetical protein
MMRGGCVAEPERTYGKYLRQALSSPLVLFALAAIAIVIILAPFFAAANAGQ